MNVLLVHGLGRTPAALFGLAAALRRAGHRTHFFAYSPPLESLPRIVRRLADRVAKLGPSPGLVGHSLGGVLLRLAIARLQMPTDCRLVCLGSPAVSPRLARLAHRFVPFRWLTRDCGALLADADAMGRLRPPVGRVTLIAGTAGPRWPVGESPNDGVVSVAEATPAGGPEPLLFPVWHTLMMDDDCVRRAVVAALHPAVSSRIRR